MSPFRLEISDHAKQRVKQRSITRAQIRQCLSVGTLICIDLRGRRIRKTHIGKKVLEVIYLEVEGGFLVVTAYWKGEWP